jgi:hypothetical protein
MFSFSYHYFFHKRLFSGEPPLAFRARCGACRYFPCPFAVPKISCSLVAHEILTAAHAAPSLYPPPAAVRLAAARFVTAVINDCSSE